MLTEPAFAVQDLSRVFVTSSHTWIAFTLHQIEIAAKDIFTQSVRVGLLNGSYPYLPAINDAIAPIGILFFVDGHPVSSLIAIVDRQAILSVSKGEAESEIRAFLKNEADQAFADAQHTYITLRSELDYLFVKLGTFSDLKAFLYEPPESVTREYLALKASFANAMHEIDDFGREIDYNPWPALLHVASMTMRVEELRSYIKTLRIRLIDLYRAAGISEYWQLKEEL